MSKSVKGTSVVRYAVGTLPVVRRHMARGLWEWHRNAICKDQVAGSNVCCFWLAALGGIRRVDRERGYRTSVGSPLGQRRGSVPDQLQPELCRVANLILSPPSFPPPFTSPVPLFLGQSRPVTRQAVCRREGNYIWVDSEVDTHPQSPRGPARAVMSRVQGP